MLQHSYSNHKLLNSTSLPQCVTYLKNLLLKKTSFSSREMSNKSVIKIIAGTDHRYTITYSIWNDIHARTRNFQYVTIKGSDGETEDQLCHANFNVINQDVLCVFQSPVNIGDYRCVILRTGGDDGIDLIQVIEKCGELQNIFQLGMTYHTRISLR